MWETLASRYENEPFVEVEPLTDPSEADEFTFDPQSHNDTNRISLRVLPHASGHVLLDGAARQPRQRRRRRGNSMSEPDAWRP